jgi:hypothetical protein
MNCPKCGATASLINADYGYGHGAEFKCYHHAEYVDGYRFVSHSAEAKAESDASRALSRANAKLYREYWRRRDAGEKGLVPPWKKA